MDDPKGLQFSTKSFMNKERAKNVSIGIFEFVEYIGVAVLFGWSWLGKEPPVEADPKSALTAVAKVPAPYQQGFLRRFQMYFCQGAKLDFLPFPFACRTVSHCLRRAVGRKEGGGGGAGEGGRVTT